MTLCGQLGIAPDKVRVLCGDIGGSFGLKIGTSREDLACAAASRHLGRPVKWIEDRREHLMASGQAREESMIAEAAVTNEGDVLGLKVDMTVDTGAYPGHGRHDQRAHRVDAARALQDGGARLHVQRDRHEQGAVRRVPRPVGRGDVHRASACSTSSPTRLASSRSSCGCATS